MAKVVSEKLGVHRPFLFYVGGFDDRKNIQFLLTAFAAADLENASLVLAGTRSPSQGRDLDSLTRQLNISDRVSYLGWVDDYELAALYATAEAFVYPSRYEGFGLQLVEAMALGCPVLASDVTSLPEILGDGGETFPLDDPERLTQLLRRVMHDSAYREALSTRSRQRGQHFSWRKTASDTLDVYARLAGR